MWFFSRAWERRRVCFMSNPEGHAVLGAQQPYIYRDYTGKVFQYQRIFAKSANKFVELTLVTKNGGAVSLTNEAALFV